MYMGYEKSAHLYDLFDQKENVDFYFHFASRAGSVLDIGAGTGRIALPLAERGVKVTCVEPSPAMRREFLEKLIMHPDIADNIQLITNDAKSFDAGRTFPAAFLSGTFDHFLNNEERLSALANIGRHLIPQGLLIFDVFLGLMKDSPLAPAGTVKIGGKEYRRLVGNKVLPGNQLEIILIFEIYQAGKRIDRIEERSRVGVIARAGVHQVLCTAGFDVTQEFSDYDFTPYQEEEGLLIIVATKGI